MRMRWNEPPGAGAARIDGRERWAAALRGRRETEQIDVPHVLHDSGRRFMDEARSRPVKLPLSR